MENWSNGLEALRTSVFGGYKKEDVLEYIDFLLSEMEILKKEKSELEEQIKQLIGAQEEEKEDREVKGRE